MSPQTVLLLVLMGCYALEAKDTGFKSMAAHFGVQDCTSGEVCTAPSQRKWVANGQACDLCGHGPSTDCYDGMCNTTSKMCVAYPAYVACSATAGADCDPLSYSGSKCCNSDNFCPSSTKKCVLYRTSGQSCDPTTGNLTCKAGLYCTNNTGPGVCNAIVYRTAGQSCNYAFPTNMTCAAPLWCSNTTGEGVCNNLRNVGEACDTDSQCKSYPALTGCVGSPKKCTLRHSVADGAIPPEKDVQWCKFGLFLDTSVATGKCVSSLVCSKDEDCEYNDHMRYQIDLSVAGVCNPDSLSAGCKSGGKGKCAVLASNCASLINDYFADASDSTDKFDKAECCIETATGALDTATKNSCKKADDASKSGAASSFLATSAIFVALVAGFFAL